MNTIPEPPPLGVRDMRGTALRTLRDRCAGLGVFTWRFDNSGITLAEPEDKGPIGLLLRTPIVARAVSKVAAEWGRQAAPEVTEVFPGAWAVPLVESRRRERTGCMLGLTLSEPSLAGPWFEEACMDATLDAAALRRRLGPMARFEKNSAGAFKDLLLWMAQDLLHIEEGDTTISGFTKQLSDCFETVDLLYSLGRSMSDLTRPNEFVLHMCRRMQATLNFGWVAVWFGMASGVSATLRGRMFATEPVELADRLELELPSLMEAARGDVRASVLTHLRGVEIPGSGQVLAFPVLRGGEPVGAVIAGDKFGDDPQISSYDIQLVEAAAGYVGAFIDNAGLYADQQSLFLGTLEALTASIDAKDRYTCGHSQRVAHLASQLAVASGMTAAEAERVRIAGLIHDVGKIGVPEGVLTKAGRLSDEEFDAIKRHPEIGHRILRDIPLMEDVLPGVLYHHERWDGKGYPHKIAGEKIPRMARIIALADTFDAMSSNRSYRSAMPRAAVLAEIQKCAGAQFDPELAKVFVTLNFDEFDRLVVLHSGGERPETLSLAA